MTNAEKILAIQYAIDHPNTEEQYYDLLERMGDLKRNYWGICQQSRSTVTLSLSGSQRPTTTYAQHYWTMLLREDHFSNGALHERYEAGQVDAILRRMINLLES